MDALIHTQARRAVALLWDDVPTGTDPDELETSLCLRMVSFQMEIKIHQPDLAELVSRICGQAQRIYDDEVWQRHHTLTDELFLRYLLELSLVNVLDYVPGLRFRIKKRHRLLATAAECVPNRLFPN